MAYLPGDTLSLRRTSLERKLLRRVAIATVRSQEMSVWAGSAAERSSKSPCWPDSGTLGVVRSSPVRIYETQSSEPWVKNSSQSITSILT